MRVLPELWTFFRHLPSASWALQWRILFSLSCVTFATVQLAQAVAEASGSIPRVAATIIAGVALGLWIVSFGFAARLRPSRFGDEYPPIAMIRPMNQSAFLPALLLGVTLAIATPLGAAKAIAFTLAGVGWYAFATGALWAVTAPAQKVRAARAPRGASVADGFQAVWLFSGLAVIGTALVEQWLGVHWDVLDTGTLVFGGVAVSCVWSTGFASGYLPN